MLEAQFHGVNSKLFLRRLDRIGAHKPSMPQALGTIQAIEEAERIVICPSNPILSIAPILAIKAIKRAMEKSKAPVVGVSPIIGGKALKGPADRVMASVGFEPSAYGVAKFYGRLLKHFVIDEVDKEQKGRIEKLGTKVTVANTIMKSLEDSVRLAKVVMSTK